MSKLQYFICHILLIVLAFGCNKEEFGDLLPCETNSIIGTWQVNSQTITTFVVNDSTATQNSLEEKFSFLLDGIGIFERTDSFVTNYVNYFYWSVQCSPNELTIINVFEPFPFSFDDVSLFGKPAMYKIIELREDQISFSFQGRAIFVDGKEQQSITTWTLTRIE